MQRRILVVDDEPMIVEGLTIHLSFEELDAAGACDRQSATAMLAAENYSIVVADLCLKTYEDGLMLIDEIRRLSPGSRIISMTGHADAALESEVLARGAARLLRKSEGERPIIDAILEVLAEIELEASRQDALDLEKLYLHTVRVLHSIPMRRFGLSASQAEDVVQDAWLLFLEKRGLIHSPRAWLAGAVSKLCLQLLDRARRLRVVDDDTLTELIEPCDDGTQSRMIVGQAMSRLDARSRELCRRIAIEGHSYAEVSDGMSLPIGSVGPLYIRAKEKLRRSLTC
jgi:RNA polymerase sigma factor (sigma-70 family)